ncbi:unnamed protein product [Orchesella dallaii]|uniref:Gustatory receptor n=1 Tax=Orchesella dallaii TaxID=48710 RepID=A0ABP1R2A1_9HEXA
MNNLEFLKYYMIFVGFYPNSLISTSNRLKKLYIFWKLFLIFINIINVTINCYRFNQNLSRSFKENQSGILISSAIAFRLILIQTSIAIIRILFLRGEMNTKLSEKYSFRYLVRRHNVIIRKYPGFSSTLFERSSKNQLLYYFVSAFSFAEGCYITWKLEEMDMAEESPLSSPLFGIFPRWIETMIEVISSFVHEINVLDGFSILTILMMNGMSYGVANLNEKLSKILAQLVKRRKKRLESEFNEPFPLAVVAEYGIRNEKYSMMDVSLLFHDILEIWGHLKGIVSLVTAVTFALWMMQLIFSSFFAVTSGIDFGYTSFLPWSFTADCLVGFTRFVCITSSVHSFYLKIEELNKLLLLAMINCNTDCCGCTVDSELGLLQDYSITIRSGSSNQISPNCEGACENEKIGIVNGDKRILAYLYGKSIKQRPFSLDACGFFNVGRPTILTIVGTVSTYLIVLLQFQMSGSKTKT